MDENFFTAPLEPGEFRVSDELATSVVTKLGGRLPHGIVLPGGEVITDFEVRESDVGIGKEKGLALAKAKLQPNHLFEAFFTLLPVEIQRLGHLTDRGPISSALYYTSYMDLLAIHIQFELLENEGEVALEKVTCPSCLHVHSRINGDMSTAKIRYHEVLDSKNPPRALCRLRRPLEIAGKPCEYLVLEAPKWRCLNGIANELSGSHMIPALVADSIIFAAEDLPIDLGAHRVGPLDTGATDRIKNKDMNALGDAIDSLTGGIEKSCKFTCKSCGKKGETEVNWVDENL